MRPHLVVDNASPNKKSFLEGRSLLAPTGRLLASSLSSVWRIAGFSKFIGFAIGAVIFLMIALLIYHYLPADHSLYPQHKFIAGGVGFIGLILLYTCGRRSLTAVPMILGAVMLVSQFVKLQVNGELFIGGDVILCSICAVVLGGIVRMITPDYERDL